MMTLKKLAATAALLGATVAAGSLTLILSASPAQAATSLVACSDPAWAAYNVNGECPSANIPSPAVPTTCWYKNESLDIYQTPDAYPTTCQDAAVSALNHARALLGQRAYHLPSNFDAQTVYQQLMELVTDDQTLAGFSDPIVGHNVQLDGSAHAAATTGNDPDWVTVLAPSASQNATGTGGAWSDDYSPLWAYYDWMYADGQGSGNLDCTPSDTSGCWGHRLLILHGGVDGGTNLVGVGYGGACMQSGLIQVSLLFEQIAPGNTMPPASTGGLTTGAQPFYPAHTTAKISTSTFVSGGKPTVSMTLTDSATGVAMPGQKVYLQQKPAGSTLGWVATSVAVTTNAKGAASAKVGPTANTAYRWVYTGQDVPVGSSAPGNAVSATVSANVEPVVSIAAQKSSITHKSADAIYGTVGVSGTKVTLQRLSGKKWISMASATAKKQKLPNKKTAVGYVIKHTWTSKGTYSLRIVTTKTTTHASATSKTIKLAVK